MTQTVSVAATLVSPCSVELILRSEGHCDPENDGEDDDCYANSVYISSRCSVPSDVGEDCDEGDEGDCIDGLFCVNRVCFIKWLTLQDTSQSTGDGIAATFKIRSFSLLEQTSEHLAFNPLPILNGQQSQLSSAIQTDSFNYRFLELSITSSM